MSVPAHKIRVDVETSFLDEQSDRRESRYVFAYTITIRNEGQVPARLLTRHWVITDANGKVQGSYQMLADDGAHFDAPIRPFRLAMPGILQ